MRELRSLGAAQQPSGLIGHTTFWSGPVRLARAFTYNMLHPRDFQTATIQPPLLGWVWAEVANRAGDAAFAEEGRAVIERLHEYLDRERADADGLIGILQPDETGLDASPMYDRPLGWRSHPNPGFFASLRCSVSIERGATVLAPRAATGRDRECRLSGWTLRARARSESVCVACWARHPTP